VVIASNITGNSQMSIMMALEESRNQSISRSCPNTLFIAVNNANLVISISGEFNLQKSLDFETVPSTANFEIDMNVKTFFFIAKFYRLNLPGILMIQCMFEWVFLRQGHG